MNITTQTSGIFLRVIMLISVWAGASTYTWASIFCPMDITIFCNDDIHNTGLTGYPVIFNHDPALVKYKDVYSGQQCYGVTVARTWFIDVNGNQSPDATEPFCVQQITISNPGGSISVAFPPDRQYGCKEDIINEKPTWITGPCDVMGVSQSDLVFEVSDDACYKIFRTFTVINWCTYKPGTPGWNGEGIWTHTQKIKVLETTKPKILSCEPKVINTDAGCQATFSISNAATDDTTCGEQLLYWTAEIDLWANGNNDFVYGYNLPGTFNLAPTKNGEEINITLPEKVAPGNHKIVWKVRDACGNYSACQQIVTVKDLKKPVPVMYNALYASFEGPDAYLKVSPRWFNVKSSDNCTEERHLKFSFSPDLTDTVRIVDCNNAGFQFFNIYVTDINGNQDYAEVFMLVFDNGSCATGPRISGRILRPGGTPVSQATFSLSGDPGASILETTSDASGNFAWEQAAIYKNSVISPTISKTAIKGPDVADFKMLQDYLLGTYKLNNFEWLAADLDGDHKIRIKDLEILKSCILTPEKVEVSAWLFAADVDTLINQNALKDIQHTLEISKSDGRIDFKAVPNGDISGANGNTVNPRSRTELIVQTEGTKLTFSADNHLVADGLQIFLHLPGIHELSGINVLGRPLNDAWYVYDNQLQVLRILINESIECNAGTALLELIFNDQAPSTDKISMQELSYILEKGYALRPVHIKNASKEAYAPVYPNPSTGTYFLPENIQIVDVLDGTGKYIPFASIGKRLELHAAPGLYTLVLRTPEGVKSVRLIKY
jgi:hypothetical protein